MLKKFLLKYTIILIVNLSIFLMVWYFLDKTFNTDWSFIVLFLILSIVSLVIITQMLIKKNLSKLGDIKNSFKKK